MADPLDVVTFAAVQRTMPVPDGDQDMVARHITVVSRFIDELCGPVVYRTVTDELHSGRGCELFLEQYPVASIGAITVNGVSLVDGDWYVDANSGMVTRAGGIVSPYSNWYWGYGQRNIAVTYVAGRYPTTDMVDPLFVGAAMMAIKGLWTSERAVNGTYLFGFGGDPNEENVDTPSGPSYVLPTAARTLLRPHIQHKVSIG